MRFLRKIGWCVVFWFSCSALAGNPTFHYEPAQEELSGNLDIQTFPGLPNYESVANGDEAEKGLYLKLDNPIDVIATKVDANAETERNVKIVQLILIHQGFWKRLENLGRGAHVVFKGKLSHRLTGHHHARVLLEVEQIRIPKS